MNGEEGVGVGIRLGLFMGGGKKRGRVEWVGDWFGR